MCYTSEAGAPRLGVVIDDEVHDASRLLGGQVIRDVQELLELGDKADRLRDVVSSDRARRASAPVAEPMLMSPVLRPPNIRDHIAFEEHATRNFTRELAPVWYRRPIHYYSNTARLVGHDGPVVTPATERLDYELEIAAVIGREVSDATADDALSAIFGFTIFNDWSARDLQPDEMAYGLGPSKGKDFASSVGPAVVTADELAAHLREGVLHLTCVVRVNGQTWAESNSKNQYHSWTTMIVHASQDSRLLPGDLLASGTVGGCSIGEAIRLGKPAHYLEPGDVVELEVEGIGVLRNTIREPVAPVARRPFRAHELPPMPQPIKHDA
ncbi:fumarylacetoacetate hydrolase family protein [Amycolatopsis alkalitolerans]|uniref:Fumarylacetoacetate hydrolase family protein n=1 Tax=Amycolatopsis alkalitolerans TaxID=2547244 RepID=A0A5C4M7F9_9PSEU|nr:fumarylacetoacetate hydrolase family protein [Amycolatopsis alkalitolerans]TNC29214.1 fumarylacetoacetate hydrolase family protein [Amycolatopsis alkalitolerans]